MRKSAKICTFDFPSFTPKCRINQFGNSVAEMANKSTNIVFMVFHETERDFFLVNKNALMK